MMSKSNIFASPLVTILIILSTITKPYAAQNNSSSSSSNCVASSCGEIDIRYPFRLTNDPANCGYPDPIFALRCIENRTVLTSSDSKTYRVEEINYSNFRVRVVDPGLDGRNYSSCPDYSTTDGLWENNYMFPDLSNFNNYVTFLSCIKPVDNNFNRLYVEEDSCGNTTAFSNSSRVYNYAGVDRALGSDLLESCVINREVLFSSHTQWDDSNSNNNKNNYQVIHDFMSYGVELTWYRTMCGECEESKGSCVVEGGNKVTCRHYCYEDTPLSERSFRCKLEYYSVYSLLLIPIIGGILGLRLLFGIPFLIGLVVYKWRKQRRSLMSQNEISESKC